MNDTPNPTSSPSVPSPDANAVPDPQASKKMLVSAIENGTVIDHIPADKVFQVVSLLHLERMTSSVTIGCCLRSKRMGLKGIIKIADKHFTEEQISQLAVICPDITLSTIKDFRVASKTQISLPSEVVGIVRCGNPRCITNHEPMRTRFHVSGGALTCHYCNATFDLSKVSLL